MPKAVIQGGMGVGVSLSGLASAVARAGGMGVISAAGIGLDEPDFSSDYTMANDRAFSREIRAARALSSGALGVNIMAAKTNYASLVKTAVAEKVDAIFVGAGLPLDLPAYLTPGSLTNLAPIVSSGRAASILCRKWKSRFGRVPDAFVVEGPLAGGHLGFKPEEINDPAFVLEKLLIQVLEAVRPYMAPNGRPIPVIAAGGVYDGADIYRLIGLGASGVQMGTRFVATNECDADTKFKQCYVDAREQDLVIIHSPVGLPGRAIKNDFLDSVSTRLKVACPYHCITHCNQAKAPYCLTLALANAKKGRLKLGFAFAGQNAYRVKAIVSVAELMDELEAGYDQAVKEHARQG